MLCLHVPQPILSWMLEEQLEHKKDEAEKIRKDA